MELMNNQITPRHLASLTLLVILLGALGGVAFAAPPAKIHPDLQRQFDQLNQSGKSSARVPVIVQFKNAPTEGRISGLAKAHGGGVGLQLVRGGAFNLSSMEDWRSRHRQRN